MSKQHADSPVSIDVEGYHGSVDYEPGESQSGLYGGNSNWRGPVWMPANRLLIGALRRFADFFGDDLLVEYPRGSGQHHTLAEVADDLAARLVAIFARDAGGRRAVFGSEQLFQAASEWRDNIPFHEYFHGDTGKGLGASHQTGWTGLVADLLMRDGKRSN